MYMIDKIKISCTSEKETQLVRRTAQEYYENQNELETL